jgi:hypothetical protein
MADVLTVAKDIQATVSYITSMAFSPIFNFILSRNDIF